MPRILCLGLALAVIGCSGGGDDSSEKTPVAMKMPTMPVCEAGKTVACPCVNDGQGVQSCASDGSKWGACECADVKPPAPTQTPAVACTRIDLPAGPAGCPGGYNGLYTDCPKEFVDSGVCVKANGFVCCPE